MNKFSEFAEEDVQFSGDKVPFDKLVNIPIIVKAHRLNESKYKKTNADKCMTVQFEYQDKPGENHVVFTGSTVLINQCEKYKNEMPFEAKIQKVNRYYTFM